MKTRQRDHKGRYLPIRHYKDVAELQRLAHNVLLLTRARDAAEFECTKVRNELRAVEASRDQSIADILKQNDVLVAERDNAIIEERIRACERVFLSTQVKRLWGLYFWLRVTFQWNKLDCLLKTIEGRWPVAGKEKDDLNPPGSL